MRPAVAIAAALLWLVAVGACAQAGRAAGPAKRDGGPPAAALLDRWCSACHDGTADRPRLDSGARLGRDLAIQAALAVSAGWMPRGRKMPLAESATLIRAMCEYGADDAKKCLWALDPRPRGVLIDPPAVLLARLQGPAYGSGPSAPSVAEGLLRGYTLPSERVVRLDPTLALLTALLSFERCGTSSVPECFARILDFEAAKVPPP